TNRIQVRLLVTIADIASRWRTTIARSYVVRSTFGLFMARRIAIHACSFVATLAVVCSAGSTIWFERMRTPSIIAYVIRTLIWLIWAWRRVVGMCTPTIDAGIICTDIAIITRTRTYPTQRWFIATAISRVATYCSTLCYA